MAEHRTHRTHRAPHEEETTEEPSGGMADAHAPTLQDAFYVLCHALEVHLEDDMPRWAHAQEIQGWMADSGGDANGLGQQALAWTHAIELLEGILGRPLLHR